MKWIGRGSAIANRFISEGLIYRIYETCEREHPLSGDQCQNPRHDLPGGVWVPPGPGSGGEGRESRGVTEQLADQPSERVRCEIVLGEEQRRAGGREGARPRADRPVREAAPDCRARKSQYAHRATAGPALRETRGAPGARRAPATGS